MLFFNIMEVYLACIVNIACQFFWFILCLLILCLFSSCSSGSIPEWESHIDSHGELFYVQFTSSSNLQQQQKQQQQHQQDASEESSRQQQMNVKKKKKSMLWCCFCCSALWVS
jgi:hypothetical protein